MIVKTTAVVVLALLAVFLCTSTAFAATDLKQLLISNNITSTNNNGQYQNDPAYLNFYNVKNAFDNITDKNYNAWSNWNNPGFEVFLSSPITSPVCKVEFDVKNPKGTPYKLFLGNDVFINGVLASEKVSANLTDCVKDFSTLKLETDTDGFNDNNMKWVSLSEVKLLANTTKGIPDPEPPICAPGTHWDPDQNKCVKDDIIRNPANITLINTNATMTVINSTLTVTVDEDTNVNANTIVSSDKDDKEEDEEDEEGDGEDKN